MLFLLTGCLVLCLCGIIRVWISLRIRAEAYEIIENLKKEQNIDVLVRDLSVSGFPWVPIVTFSGTVRWPGTAVHIPLLYLRGVFLPGTPLKIEIPDGYAVHTLRPIRFQNLLLAQLVKVEIVLPDQMPEDFSEQSLHSWQTQGNAISVRDITILRDDGLALMGAGGIGLDTDLQPDLRFHVRILRPDLLIRDLRDGELLKSSQEQIAQSIAATLTRDGGLDAELSVRKSGLFVGPFRVSDVPRLAWTSRVALPPPILSPDKRNPPAPDQ